MNQTKIAIAAAVLICASGLARAQEAPAPTIQEGPAAAVDAPDPALQETLQNCHSLQYGGASFPDSGGEIDATNSAFVAHVLSFKQRSTCARLMAATALGLKSSSLILQEEVKALSAGSLDKNAVNKSREQSAEADKEIEATIAESKEVRATSRGPLVAAIAYYALTVRDGIRYFRAARDYMRFSAQVLKGAGFVQKARMAMSMRSTLGYAKESPGAVRSVLATMSSLVSYAKAHQIDVPADSESALGALGELGESDDKPTEDK